MSDQHALWLEERMRARAAEDRERELLKERDVLLGLLKQWLTWPGRGSDEAVPLEFETAKALGHSDECELVEYDACTCGKDDVAAATDPDGTIES